MKLIHIALCAAACGALQGCAPVVVGAAAGGAVLVADDKRTTGTMIDDQTIELKIAGAFNDSKTLGESHINVTSFNGIVLLSGEVATPAQSSQAEQLAQKVQKVRRVHNELTVGPNSSLAARSKDSWITTVVKSKLVGADNVSANQIKVVTEARTVFLMGLASHKEADAAVAAIRDTAEAKRIVKLFEYTD